MATSRPLGPRLRDLFHEAGIRRRRSAFGNRAQADAGDAGNYSVALVIVPPGNPREDAAHEAAVQAYAQKLKPGMTRVEVETYLRKQGTQFMQMCCVEKNSYWDDLVKIGEERHPWYCSEHCVYVAFLFTTTQLNEPWKAERWKPTDTDVLKEMRRYDMLGGCL